MRQQRTGFSVICEKVLNTAIFGSTLSSDQRKIAIVQQAASLEDI